jgi:hypothetical protein
MIELLTREMLDAYLAEDSAKAWLDYNSREDDEKLTCQRWLRQTPAKRLVYQKLYGDLIAPGPRKSILDVGGGLMAFTRELARRHDYTLLDLLAHDAAAEAQRMEAEAGRSFVVCSEWFGYDDLATYDVVIANDLFPNVDQRLQLFLDRYVAKARCIRMSLTFYNTPRFYLTRRVDADEILCMLAWNGKSTRVALEPYIAEENRGGLSLFEKVNPSVYDNGRQVCLVEISGRHSAAD